MASTEKRKDIRHWEDGARLVGDCPERDCAGKLLLLEDAGPWLWAQCNACHVQTGLGLHSPEPGRDEPVRPPKPTGDAFLDAT